MKQNKWKVLFFLLVSLNIVGVIFVSIFLGNLLKPSEEKKIELGNKPIDTQDILLQIQTNKQDLNRMIDHYIEKELSGNVDYKVLLTDEVELYGTLPIFGLMIDITMTFEPVVLNNGDLELHQKKMYIGQLKIPPSVVLTFIQNQYTFPDWVIIQPDKEKVYVSVQNLELKSNLKVRVEQFDLKQDQIQFLFQFPM
jgi:uncharacterized protein YpmS